MSPATTRNLWWLTAGSVLAGGVALAAWAVAWPLDVGPEEAAAPAVAAVPATRPAEVGVAVPSQADLTLLTSRPLRGPLEDPGRAAIAGVEATALPVGIRLTGTIVEPGHSMAIFASGLAEVHLAGVGGFVLGAEVLEVREEAVRVLFEGRLYELALERARPDASDAASGPRRTAAPGSDAAALPAGKP